MHNQRDLIHESEWRTLIILDACRYDKFVEVNEEQEWGYNVEPVWSAGHETKQWYSETWMHKHYKDVVLASDTPVPWRKKWGAYYRKFHKAHPLWKTPPPEASNKTRTLKYVVAEANKIRTVTPHRLVVHLIPPHLPYYFDEGRKWLLETFGDNVLGNGRLYNCVEDYGRRHGWEKLVDYYKRNIVAPVEEIRRYDWGDNAVISADHGELLGEGQKYTHSNGAKEAPVLRKVPWVKMN